MPHEDADGNLAVLLPAPPRRFVRLAARSREFEADGPNKKWVADFTYVWTAEGWPYFAAVMDLYSRHIVGWSMSDTMHAKMVTDAMLMALWRRGEPKALMVHSDQGSQYTSDEFQQLFMAQGITCSMSRRGDCWDNAAMESLFSSLKTERLSRKVYSTRDEARADVFDYVERFYNQQRRHSTLDFVSPVQFEQGLMWTAPGLLDKTCPHAAASSNASGLMPPRWL